MFLERTVMYVCDRILYFNTSSRINKRVFINLR